MSATHMGRGDMFHNAGTQNICKDSGTQVIQTGPDVEATQDRQCRNYLEQGGYDPADQKANAERQGGQLFEPSCKWIYENAEFHQWIDGADPPSLWLHGGPGKGKSMLLCSVINHLSEWAKEAPGDSGPSRLVTYSFFSDPDGVHEASFVVASLVYGLVKQQPSYFRRVSNVYDHETKYPFQGNRSFTALENILEDMLRDATGARVILVVDALDECKTDLDRLLHLILKTSSLQNVRWLVSSRGLRTVCQEFDVAESNIRKLSLDQTGEDIQQAVQVYTHHQMWRLHHLRMSEEERETLERRLLRKAGGTFLWLSIVMAELKNVASWDIDDVVDGLPDDLESLYVKLLQNLVEDLGQKKSKNLVKDVLYRTLATTAAALRPLYIEELKELADFPAKIRDNSRVEELIDKCGAFLTCQHNQVFLIHLSAKEFLTPEKLQSAFQSDPLDIHSHLFSRSMSAMKENLKRDIYNLEKPGIGIEDISLTPSPDPLCGLKYSCLHWVDHLAQVQEKSPWHYHAVRCFIEKCLLHWLEAMSLQRKFGEAVKAVQKLRSLMNTKDQQLDSLTEDVRHFVLFHQYQIKNYPLQIYISALIFSPNSSWVRRFYEGEEPTWILLKPNMESTWPHYVRSLGTNCAPSRLAISTDGKLLASTYLKQQESEGWFSAGWYGSGPDSAIPGTLVVIWGLDLRELIKVFPLDFEANTLGFLSDSKRLALAGSENRFEIWSTDTFSRLQSLQNPDQPSACFTSLAVSVPAHHLYLKGDLIAFGSDNGAVRIWDLTAGNCIRSIRTSGQELDTLTSNRASSSAIGDSARSTQTSERRCNALEFSLDGQKLAVGLESGTVEVWDSQSGVMLTKLEGDDVGISSIAFVRDYQLVSASGRTIRIWDLATASCIRALEMASSASVVSLGSSTDFAYTAFGQSTVEIRNNKGDCTQVLDELDYNVGCLAFCVEQQLLVSGTDCSINIWDLKLVSSIQLIDAHTGWVDSLAFSSDGRLLASNSHSSIKIWDTVNCACIHSIDCANGASAGLAFSPDSRYLVLRQRTWWDLEGLTNLTFLNTDNGKAVKTFPNASGREAFSPDGRLIALALDRSILTIWDADAFEQRHQIQRKVTCLVFSADGNRLAVASDTSLEIWGMSNGQCMWTVDHQQTRVISITLSADMQVLAAGTDGGRIDVWDISATSLRVTVSSQGWVDEVALSPNQEFLAWTNYEGLHIRDLKHGWETGFFRTGGFNTHNLGSATLQFDHSDSSRLCSSIGDLDLRAICDGRVVFHGYHLDKHCEWIVRGNERMVFLPPEYQPRTASIISGQTIAVGTSEGRVLLFRFVQLEGGANS